MALFPSAIGPKPHGQDILIPEPNGNMEYSYHPIHSDMNFVAGDDAYKPEDDQPIFFRQAELNDLTRGLNLSKTFAQLSGSRLKEKHRLTRRTTFYWYRDRERE